MECISKRSSGSDGEDYNGTFRPIPWGRRSPPPPPLPPKPSAPPSSHRYPPQVPYFHPPTEFQNPANQVYYQQDQPNQFYAIENNWYERSSVHNNDPHISCAESVQVVPAYALNEEFMATVQPTGRDSFLMREERFSLAKPPASPVMQRHRRTSIPRNSFVPIPSPVVFCFQTPKGESNEFEDQRRRTSLSVSSELIFCFVYLASGLHFTCGCLYSYYILPFHHFVIKDLESARVFLI